MYWSIWVGVPAKEIDSANNACNQETAIRHLIEDCCPEAFGMLGTHCEEFPWKWSAFSELMLRLPVWWLNGVVQLPAISHPSITLPNESTIEINWTLPLNPTGQQLLFRRVICDYAADTGMVELSSKRISQGKTSIGPARGRLLFRRLDTGVVSKIVRSLFCFVQCCGQVGPRTCKKISHMHFGISPQPDLRFGTRPPS